MVGRSGLVEEVQLRVPVRQLPDVGGQRRRDLVDGCQNIGQLGGRARKLSQQRDSNVLSASQLRGSHGRSSDAISHSRRSILQRIDQRRINRVGLPAPYDLEDGNQVIGWHSLKAVRSVNPEVATAATAARPK